MYTLYYYPHNASMAVHFVLNELRVDYQLSLVDRKACGQKSAEYLALNPAGRIPTLVDNGVAIFESAAICLHLAEQHTNANLIPAVGHATRPAFFQWLMYLTNTVQAELMMYIYPQNHTTDLNNTAAIVCAQETRITAMFALLDAQLKNKDYLVGESLSVCDYYLFMLTIWAGEFTKPPMDFEYLARYLKKLAKLPAVLIVAEKENINLNGYL
jgi:glutathione S-transferase